MREDSNTPIKPKPKDCPVCKGFGNIWVNWNQWPVTCGHCHGTGRQA